MAWHGRTVREHRSKYPSLWASTESFAPKIGCVPKTLNNWVRQHEVEEGLRDDVSYDNAMAERHETEVST